MEDYLSPFHTNSIHWGNWDWFPEFPVQNSLVITQILLSVSCVMEKIQLEPFQCVPFKNRLFAFNSHWQPYHIDGLVQERHNSSAMELHLFCVNPSIWCIQTLRINVTCMHVLSIICPMYLIMQTIMARWIKYLFSSLMNWDIFVSDNGLAPIQCRAITSDNVDSWT